MDQYVIFKSHQQLFAIRVQNVARVIEAREFIALPEVADFILGIYEYQENMVPIVDVRRKLFKEFTTKSPEAKVILCKWHDRLLGLFVEDIVGISFMEDSRYEEELVRSALKKGYIEKILKLKDDVVMLLALDYLFDNKEEGTLLDNLDQIEAGQGEDHGES